VSTSTAFDALAADYHLLWNNSQRSQVWREVDSLFYSGDRVLDLGCGTGDDALHLAECSIDVLGIDASAKMVQIAVARGVAAQRFRIEDLSALEGQFSGAISNFGALNCVADLRPVATQLARLVRGGGAVAICIMARFAWGETLAFARKLDFRRAVRRWPGRTIWRGMAIFYYSSRQMRNAFAPEFLLQRRISIGRGDHQLYVFRRRIS